MEKFKYKVLRYFSANYTEKNQHILIYKIF